MKNSLYSKRELEVIRHIMQGKTNAEIGYDLGISEKTVKYHITSIYKIAQVKNRANFIINYSKVLVIND